MRIKFNQFAHKYLPEILCILALLIGVDIYLGNSQRVSIKNNSDTQITNQKTLFLNDSISALKLNEIEKNQSVFVNNAEELREKTK